MAKLNCPCGNQLSNVCSPNTTEGYLITDIEQDGMDESISSLDILDIGRCVWECENCGRLAFDYPHKTSSTVKWYCTDDKKYGGLMKTEK